MVLASYGSRPSYCDEPTPRLHRQIIQRSLNLPASESDSSRCLSRRILSRKRLRPHYFQRRQPSPTPERVVSFWWLPEREGESAGDWTSGERFSLRSACQDATGSLQASPAERGLYAAVPRGRARLLEGSPGRCHAITDGRRAPDGQDHGTRNAALVSWCYVSSQL